MAGHFVFALWCTRPMTVKDIQTMIEQWAPKEIAWEKDNIGLQVGSADATVRGVFVCLDVTEDIIEEAAVRNADLIISHHPLLFRPLRSVLTQDPAGKCLGLLLRSKINLCHRHRASR